MAESPRMSAFQLAEGKPTVINFNRPVKFHIAFVHGTYIKGVIPPNSDFTVCNHGDVTEFSITVDEDSVREMSLVPPSAEETKKRDG